MSKRTYACAVERFKESLLSELGSWLLPYLKYCVIVSVHNYKIVVDVIVGKFSDSSKASW